MRCVFALAQAVQRTKHRIISAIRGQTESSLLKVCETSRSGQMIIALDETLPLQYQPISAGLI